MKYCRLRIFNVKTLMKYIILVSLLNLILSCQTKIAENEDPSFVAKSYCDCLQEQLRNAEDSTVILTDCENTEYSKSRLMRIYADFNNRNKYSKETLDSASKFAIQVRDIEDTLCYNKIDFTKVKKIPHIKM